MKKTLMLASFVSIFVLLSGCGSVQTATSNTTANATVQSESSNTTSQSQKTTSKPTLKNSDWSKVESDANSYKGYPVDIKGQIFTDPISQNNQVQYQIYLDPQNSSQNTIVITQGAPKFKNGDYIEVKGTVYKEISAQNSLGATLTLPLIDGTSVTKSTREAVVAPTIATSHNIPSETQNGVTVSVDKVEFAKSETRVYLTVTNKSSSGASIEAMSATLVQGTNQLQQKMLFNANYPTLPTTIAKGVIAHTVIVFDAADVSGGSLKLDIPAMSSDFTVDMKDFVFTIPQPKEAN